MSLIGLNLTSTLAGLFFLNALLAYSAFPIFALGRLNLGFMAFAGIGGYTAAILHQKQGISPGLAVAVAVAASAALAVPIGLLLSRVRGIYLAIASVNLVAAFQVCTNNLEGLTGGAIGLSGLPIVSSLAVLGICVAVVVAFLGLVSRSGFGRSVRVQRADELLALVTGNNVSLNVALLFVCSGAVAGLQGALTAFWYGFVSPEIYSFHLMLLVVAMVVVGGTNHWLGPLVGAAFFTILPEWLRFADTLRNVIVGGILLLVIYFFPEGIVGSIVSRLSLRRARSSTEARARRTEIPVGAP